MNEVVVATDEQIESQALGKLRLLSAVRRGLPQYFQQLLHDPDVVLRVGALVALLEMRAVWADQVELVLEHARYGAVKRRAFPFFVETHEYELARRVAETPSEDVDRLMSDRMAAELELDFLRVVDLDFQLFLAHGTPDYLRDAEDNAEALNGWRGLLPVSVTALLARPIEPTAALVMMRRIRGANRTHLLEKMCDTFQAAGIFQAETMIFRAALLLDAGEAKRAIVALGKVPDKFPDNRVTRFVQQLKAEALHKAGDYRAAYAAFEKMNAVLVSKAEISAYRTDVLRRTAMKFEPAPPDDRGATVLTLTGFPRSATTLLENALEAHPGIEAFEEIPAFGRMARFMDRFAPRDGFITADTAQRARDTYYDEVRRQSKKPDAKWRIDKLPPVAADAAFLKNIFPERRYVFSIRHPYDVVFSCFRQTFVANTAMENFRTIANAASIYDFTMTQWFSVHSFDDPTVCYVRYEELVNDFRPTIERVLGFIGAEWDDSILGFAENAERRFAKTPSYQKVRSGIKIGVQSSWKNYDFLWHTKETAVLDNWVKHLGYES